MQTEGKINICGFKYFTNNVPLLCYVLQHFFPVPSLAKQEVEQKKEEMLAHWSKKSLSAQVSHVYSFFLARQ